MAEVSFRNLVPGKRYKIVVKANTLLGTLTAFPSIDFIVPEAPPRARNHRLTANTVIKAKTIKKNRKLKIYKYKIEIINSVPIVIISTSRLDLKKKNKVKPGDTISVSATDNPDSINVTKVKALNRKNKNRIRYYHPNPAAQATSNPEWRTYTADNDETDRKKYPITHHNSKTVTIKKAKYVRMRIPKPILQNLTWNDDVKDFVFIVYIKGKKKSRLQNRKRRYVWDTDASPKIVNTSQPPRLTGGGGTPNPDNDSTNTINLATQYVDGHPATFLKEITDDKFYQFQFIIARYIRTYDEITNTYTWTGYWIERNTPFLKKLSRPVSWKNK